jgi:hypothetical protein
MGVYSDVIANARAMADGKGGSYSETVARAIEGPISKLRDKQGDPKYPAGLDMSNAVQLIQPFPTTVWEGEFSLTVRLQGRRPFTTLNLAYDSTAEQISQAIDQAAIEDGVTGYTPGDIKVTMTSNLNKSGMALVFNGTATQKGNHAKVRMNDLGLKSDPLRQPNHRASDSLTVPKFVRDVSRGKFILAFVKENRESLFRTAKIPYNASAANIELAIDAAATAAGVPDWVNGNIEVSGGPLTTDDVTLILAGGRKLRVFVGGVNLGGHTKTGKVGTVTRGQPRRTTLAAMKLMGLIDFPSPLPSHGSVDGVTLAANPRLKRFKRETIHLLCKQAGKEEESRDVYRNLMSVFGLRHLAH